MPAPLASLVEYLLRPTARHENDRSAAESLRWRGAGGLPPGLELQWLGTAGFRIGYEGFQLLIDPYLTRPGPGQLYTGRPLAPDPELVRRYVPGADAVLVGHTHFDHALDVPLISALYDAPVYGSRSLTHLMALSGQAARAVEVELGRVYALGPFEVTFVESVHSKLVFGLTVPAGGELTCDHLDHLHAGRYRCGQVFGIHIAVAGVTIYHQGSADLLDDRIVHRGVDYFLMGIAGRGFTRDYAARILGRLEPTVIVPHHHDDFHRPLAADMGFSLNVNFGGFVDEVARVSRDFDVRTLAPLETVRGE